MSWEIVKLGDVCDVRDGTHNSPKYFSTGFPLVTSKNIKEGKIDLREVNYISESDFNEINRRSKVDKGDILLPMIGTIGNPVILHDEPIFAIKNVCLLKKSEKIFNGFLYYILISDLFKENLFNKSKGGTQKFISLGDIRNFQIPLPALPIQKRIAEILDAADTLKRKDQDLLKKYDELAQAIFIDMFGDPVKNEKGWEVKRLGSLTSIGSGSTPSRQIDEYFGGNIPWVKTTEVNGEVIFSTEELITEKGLKNSSCKLYPKNSIIIAMYGQGKTRGQVGLLGVEAATNQACAVIRPCEELNSTFLFNYLKLSYKSLRDLGRGGNQENLNKGMIEDFSIIFPDYKKQLEFNKKIEILNSLKSYAKQNKSENLFNSLIQKAFKGELVT